MTDPRVDALWEYIEYIGGTKWKEAKSRHGLTPPAKAEEPERLKYGAEIVTTGPGRHRVKVGPYGLIVGRNEWMDFGEDYEYGDGHESRAAALAALNSAPPPPGWVEPESPKPPPGRWFKDWHGYVRKYPSLQMVHPNGRETVTKFSIDDCILHGYTELDPATNEPLKPAPPATITLPRETIEKVRGALEDVENSNSTMGYLRDAARATLALLPKVTP